MHSLAILHFADVNVIVAHRELSTPIHPEFYTQKSNRLPLDELQLQRSGKSVGRASTHSPFLTSPSYLLPHTPTNVSTVRIGLFPGFLAIVLQSDIKVRSC